MADTQQCVEANSSSCNDFKITTALLWSMSSGSQATQHTTKEEDYLIDLHCDRILAAAQAFSWTVVLDMFDGEDGHQHFKAFLRQQIPAAIKQSSLKSLDWKIRLLVSKDGNVQVLPAPIVLRTVNGVPRWPRLPEKLFETSSSELCLVLVDSVPTPVSEFTTHKTNSRKHYDEARSRSNIEHAAPTESEVLLFNEDHEVMEASLCTPYFLRNGLWITPALTSGGHAGVSRRVAFEAGLCVERALRVDELVAGEMIWLSNAVRGFMPGRLQLLQNSVTLTLDLNSQAHAPAPGVLDILTLVAGTPNDYDLSLPVMLGTSVLKFSFTGMEIPPALATGRQPDLEGSTMTPETYAHESVEHEVVGVEDYAPSFLDSEDTDSLDSDEPIATQKKQRRKNLHHPAVRNDSYEQTESEDSSKLQSNKRRKLRSNRPTKGAFVEPSKDARDIFEGSSSYLEELHPRPSNTGRAPNIPPEAEKLQPSLATAKKAPTHPSNFEKRRPISPKTRRAPMNPTRYEEQHTNQIQAPRTGGAPGAPSTQVATPRKKQRTVESYGFHTTRPEPQGCTSTNTDRTPDLYMGLDSNTNNLDAILVQNNPVQPPQQSRRRGKTSQSPKHSRSQSPLPCAAQ